jgi:DNA repair exonuclease SbcCD ATPase subunit
MGRPATITYEQVKEFMDERLADGDKPTIDQVWDAFDKKGSKGTIHKLVKRYHTESEVQKTPASLRLLPPGLQGAILAFADQTAHVAREAVAVQLIEYQQHAEVLAEDNERLAADVAQRDEELKSAAADKIALDRKIAQLESELAGAREQIAQERAAVERATSSLARLEQRLEETEKIQGELRLARDECTKERDARTEADLVLAEMRAQKALHEQRAQDLAASLASARAACQKIETRNAELDTCLKRAERELADAQRELAVQYAVKAKPAGRASKAAKAALQGALALDGEGSSRSAG